MIVHAGILFGAALLGGVMNAVAGGGSFLTFPALIVAGIAPISATDTALSSANNIFLSLSTEPADRARASSSSK